MNNFTEKEVSERTTLVYLASCVSTEARDPNKPEDRRDLELSLLAIAGALCATAGTLGLSYAETMPFVARAFGEKPGAGGGLTHDEVLAACKNVGIDLECGACAEQFYTGSHMTDHTCGKYVTIDSIANLPKCRCQFREGQRYADPRCFAFHEDEAVGYVSKPDGSEVVQARALSGVDARDRAMKVAHQFLDGRLGESKVFTEDFAELVDLIADEFIEKGVAR